MNTSKIVLLCVGVFFIINFALAWICFFKFQAVPECLVQSAAGSGALEGILSGAVGIAKILKKKQ